ncbi:fanconi anemia group M protein [Clonorchis sinensis]|uniref:Fanconi anemia group M protein n=1 Tax=Clonorchis sinensis TaxID=79923 RepID=H2KPP2_CLOSI|nr:fanconi anemia group M protein [Clonorchis sinensis]
MKQTSLIQSWTRALNRPFGQGRSSAVTTTTTSTPRTPPDPHSAIRDIGADADDHLLATLLDQYVDDTEVSPVVNQEAAIAALRSRPPIAYRPTGNDSDNLAGFDTEAGRTWIYPLNVNIRDYQFHITEQCLYKNTLVCLPTGLGKTLVAAVVMYNFLRWYPHGKSVFMAPTRPLVAQQLTACGRLLGLSSDTAIELTGSTPQTKRQRLWTNLRAFFLTPQVLMNDLQAGVCPSADLRLLIFDEAHKATGNHAYCQVIRLLTAPPHNHRLFRVVALSATPASDIQGVQTILANLLISHLELRTDTSVDVKRYTQHRQLETIVVPLGPELNRFRSQLIECARIPLERLRMRGALRQGMGDLRPERIAKFTVIKAREEWSSGPNAVQLSSIDAGAVQCDFGSVICLLHAMELLDQHGLRPLYQYLGGVLNGQRASASVRAEMMRLSGVEQLWSDLVTRFKPAPGADNPSSTQAPFVGGHPKLEKLKQLLVQHFRSHAPTAQGETRVIVFSQFRDSVEEIMHMLKQLRPLVRPASFIGQGSGTNRSPVLAGSGPDAKMSTSPLMPSNRLTSGGISQRDQLRVMDAFRKGVYNTLVSTCVGEEGLDVGQVDLIICFDAFKSPVRLMQRLGRTGRQRLGRIVMLLTEGREERNHAVSMARTSTIHRALLEGGAYKRLAFYPHNPRMIPLGITPEVDFRVLEPEVSTKDTVLPTVSNESTCRKRPSRAGKNRLSGRTPDEAQSHADAVGLSHINLRLTPVGPSPLLSLCVGTNSHSDWKSECPQLTQLYDLTSPKRLTSLRTCLQSRLSPREKVGSSTSSRHLVSVLHLIELHRRGETQLSYHALGLRSVNVDTTLPPSPVAKADLESSQTEPMLKTNGNANPESDDRDTLRGSFTAAMLKMPQSVKGLVSGKLFFPVVVSGDHFDSQLIDVARNLTQSVNTLPGRISPASLQSAWERLLQTNEAQGPKVALPPKVDQPLEIPSVMGLEQWVDKSLLEAIEGDFTQNDGMPGTDVAKSTSKPTANQAPKNTLGSPLVGASQTGLAAAFCLASPKQLNLSAVARSTPRPKSPIHRRSDLGGSVSQINLTDALAILDRSTIRLDISGLVDDGLDDQPAPMDTLLRRSVVFNGPICPTPSKSDTLNFGTKLQLGEEFGEDFLAPSQRVASSVSTDPDPVTKSHSTPHGSPREPDPFELPSQFSWSPISVRDMDELTADAKEDCLTHSTVTSEQSRSEPWEADTTNLSQLQSNTRQKCLNSSSPIAFRMRRAKGHSHAHRFLLTQAEVGDGHSADEFDGTGLDVYDESFIDDSRDTTEPDERSSSRLDTSNMIGVYLQSIRSPPIGFAKASVCGDSAVTRKTSSKRLGAAFHSASANVLHQKSGGQPWPGTRLATIDSDSEDFIFSQPPEHDDDYQLDSFCVDSEDPGAHCSPNELLSINTQKPKKRRRIITDSD